MKKIAILLVCFLSFQFSAGFCQIRLPRLMSDGAILQRNTEIMIWGWASPDEQVDLLFRNTNYSTHANHLGDWSLTLPPQEAGGPYEMVFAAGKRIILHNILFGDVWICSGQSNMQLSMKRVQDVYGDVIQVSANSAIRHFVVPNQYDFNKEHDDLDSGSWEAANPTNLPGFSAVAYFFAKEINSRYDIPIGLINASLGGSPVEAWMSEDALLSFPYASQELRAFKNRELISEIQESDRIRQESWYNELNNKDKGLIKGSEWFLEDLDDRAWKEMEVPGFWADQEIGHINGSVWFRKKIEVPERMTGQEARLWLGRIVDQDFVYVNGVFAGSTGYQYPPRKYTINPTLLKAGINTIAVRIINEQGKGGFISDKPYFLSLGNDTIDLRGDWKYQPGATMSRLEGPTFIRWKAGGLYKKMIAPLLKYSMKGVIWYQGESNTNDAQQYATTFPALISDWREKWQIGNFPFLFVQLANFMEESDEPVESDWAELRQVQLETLSLPNTGMAVTIDLGEWNDIHPLNKLDVGKRLAQQAYHVAYHEQEDFKLSPYPRSSVFTRKKVTIEFSSGKGGLVSKNGEPLAYFEISNNGTDYYKAHAQIKGSRIIVWNENVKHPVAVRYAWANNPAKANLYSSEGLPASPFQIKKENSKGIN